MSHPQVFSQEDLFVCSVVIFLLGYSSLSLALASTARGCEGERKRSLVRSIHDLKGVFAGRSWGSFCRISPVVLFGVLVCSAPVRRLGRVSH